MNKWSPKFQDLSDSFRLTVWPWFSFYSHSWPFRNYVPKQARIAILRDVYQMYCAGGEL